jgi:hypothetical protein
MYSMDDLKENRDAQITVACIVFFLIAFPTYFSIAADRADGSLGGGVGDYQVNGDLTYIQLDSDSVYVEDGGSWSETFNTDALNDADELNIVGVRVLLSYGEDETSNGVTCGADGADTISGTATHLEFTATADGQNNGGSGSHDVAAVWYNESMIGAVVSGLTINEIRAQLDSNGAGLGDHSVEISVIADVGNQNPIPIGGCSRTDNGEQVDYTIELIVLEYNIAPYVEIDV